MHYDLEREKEFEVKRELKDIDTSHYTNQFWYDEMCNYLVNVTGMNKKQVKAEFDKRFPELLVQDLF